MNSQNEQQSQNEQSPSEPVVFDSDYDLFASSPVSDSPDPMWEKYCYPYKGDYNIQQYSEGGSETASQEKNEIRVSQVFAENEKLKVEIDCLRTENESLKAENNIPKDQLKKLQS